MPVVHFVIRTVLGQECFSLDWEPSKATERDVNAGRARRLAVSHDIATCCGLRGVTRLYKDGLLK